MKYLLSLLLAFAVLTANAIDLGFTTFTITLAVADTRQSISSSTINSFGFVIQNPSTNIVSIFVGGSNVTTSGAAIGLEVPPGASVSLTSTDNLTSPKIFMVSTGTAIPVTVGAIK